MTRAGAPPILVVVVDTEEEFDWHAPFDRARTGVSHLREVHGFQVVCDVYGIRPVYAITYPVATQEDGIAPLREIHASGRCEIGAHLHPWVTPPHEEEVNARNSYPGNLPRALERSKIESLARAIEDRLGVRPRAYKSGRYGFGPNTADALADLGFEVDLSPLPAFDLSQDGGPDWSDASPEPRWLRPGLLTIPATSAWVGFARSQAAPLARLAAAPALSWTRLPSVLSRSGALERLMLSPEGFLPEHHARLTRDLLARGHRAFSFTLHSPSLRPGCTPYVRTERDREKFLDACRRYFEFFRSEIGGVSMTPSELKSSWPSPA